MKAILVNQSTFDAELKDSNIPILLDIFTPSCGPCRMLVPILDKIAEEFDGRVKVLKLNGSQDIDLALSYSVRSVPALIFFKDGKEVDRKTGFLTENKLREWLNEMSM
jgi:thioredoxin 1